MHKVLFLERRTQFAKTCATLVASGPYGKICLGYLCTSMTMLFCSYLGKIHFWNVYEGARPMGVFKAVRIDCDRLAFEPSDQVIQILCLFYM